MSLKTPPKVEEFWAFGYTQVLALSFTYFRGVAHKLQAELQHLYLSIIQILREELLPNESSKVITVCVFIYIKMLKLCFQSDGGQT